MAPRAAKWLFTFDRATLPALNEIGAPGPGRTKMQREKPSRVRPRDSCSGKPFLDTDHGGAPYISWVSLAYQPKNVAPVVDDIALQDHGIRLQGFSAQTAGPAGSAPVQLRIPQRTGGSGSVSMNFQPAADSTARNAKVDVPPQGFEDRDYSSVLWSAHDENDDELVYAIYYRGEGEENWRLLKDKLTQKYYSWDTSTMPDGAYYLKIVASDSPSNPPDQALSSERESDRFEIANTPPRIANLKSESPGGDVAAKITFEGISSAGAIERAQYSIDAGDWLIAFPVGLLSDAPVEAYEIRPSGLGVGEHTVAVQIADRFGNTAAAKITFTVPARASK